MRACALGRLRALKAGATRRRREKTFIVYECGLSQVLSGENREVRSGFEVSEKIVPPLLPLWTRPPSPTLGTFVWKRRVALAGGGSNIPRRPDSTSAASTLLEKRRQNIFVSQCKRYISKEGAGRAAALPFPPPPEGSVTRPQSGAAHSADRQ